MFKVFIDTNVFLRLYQTKEGNIARIFEDISNLKSSIVFVDQVFDEFLRNRDKILTNQIDNVSKQKMKNLHVTPLIKSLDEFSDLTDAKRIFAEKHTILLNRIKAIKEDIGEDIVYQNFCSLYNDSEITIYEKTDAIIDKAHKRMLIGNPPIDEDKNTIGDQVIWETLLSELDENLIFITYDGTYKNHITFLKNEYKQKVDKELIVTERVSEALNKISATPSDELIEFERNRKYNDFIEEKEVKDMLSHFENESIDMSPEMLYNIFKESNDEIDIFLEKAGISQDIEDRYRKPGHSIYSDYIRIYRKYFNPDYSLYPQDSDD